MIKIRHFLKKTTLLVVLAAVFSAIAYSQPQRSSINANQIQYWVGNGANSVILIVNFCDQSKALAWGYRYDGQKTVANMLNDLNDIDPRLTVIGLGSGYITDFHYNDATHPNLTFGNYESSIIYRINGGYVGGVAYTYISDGDIVEFGGIGGSCGYPWDFTVYPVSAPSAPPVNTYTVTLNSSNYGSLSPSGTTSVNQGEDLVIEINPNEGYILGELKAGSTDVTSQVQNNRFTLTNVTSDTVISVKFKIAKNNTITESDVQYWVGTGVNKVIFAVNWCMADTALAWGYRFDGDSVIVKDVIDAIKAADKRFNYTMGSNGFLSDIIYREKELTLKGLNNSYWMYNINEEPVSKGMNTQKVANGAIIEWGNGTLCNITDDYQNNSWTFVITPATTTPVYSLSVNVNNSFGTVTPNDTIFFIPQNDSIKLTVNASVNHNLDSVKLGGTNITSQMTNNIITVKGLVSDTTLSTYFRLKKNNTIIESDIIYWVGTGANKIIFAVNWCNPDTALAWGYRFDGESAIVKDVMDAIKAADSRFNYTENSNFISDIIFTEGSTNLTTSPVANSWWAYNINEETANMINIQTAVNGDVIEWGNTPCGLTDSYWNNAWLHTITPVTEPHVTGIEDAIENSQITLAPNPANQYTILNINGIEGNITVKILSVNGTEVFSENIYVNGYISKTIDLSNIKSGLYIVTIQHNGTVHKQKLVIY